MPESVRAPRHAGQPRPESRGIPRGARCCGAASAAVLALALALSAAAGAQVTRTSEYLEKMDADGDGRVSLAEYQAWMSYAFDGMDRNADGVLSPDELPGGKGRALTRDEHLRRLAERFRKQDSSGDGFLDARELAAPPLR